MWQPQNPPSASNAISNFHPKGRILLTAQGNGGLQTHTFKASGAYQVSYLTAFPTDLAGVASVSIYLHRAGDGYKSATQIANVSNNSHGDYVTEAATYPHYDCAHGCYLDVQGDEPFALAVIQ